MPNDTLVNKVAIVERCVLRAREEYNKDPDTFTSDFTRQDAAILNIQRSCEASLDIAQILVRQNNLGIAQSARDNFKLLEHANVLSPVLSASLQKMVGFRNIAVHQYQALQLPIVISIIKIDLDSCLNFGRIALEHA